VLSPVWLQVGERELTCSEHVGLAIREEFSRPVDTAIAPQMRATLIRVTNGDAILALTTSHLAMDGWSVRLFAREFMAVCVHEAEGTRCSLPMLQAQYVDFSAWQQRRFWSKQFAIEEEYWRRQWIAVGDDALHHRDIPFARSNGSGMDPRQVDEVLAVDESLHVKALVRRLNATPSTIFRTAMTIVLHHYTGRHHIAFWANFANRRHDAHMSVIGWYSNTHIVPVRFQSECTCRELIALVGNAIIDAQNHEALPLPALWQRLGQMLDRLDMRINFDALRRDIPTPSGALVTPLVAMGLRPADLDIRVSDNADAFVLIATYNRMRYQADGVRALLSSMRRIVSAIVEAPDTTVSECARFIT
jgi:hypothetical protein